MNKKKTSSSSGKEGDVSLRAAPRRPLFMERRVEGYEDESNPSLPRPSPLLDASSEVARLQRLILTVPPPPSPAVAALQQQLLKKEEMFQKACRAARNEQLRAERAESLLDDKRDVKRARTGREAELEKRLADLSKKLIEASQSTKDREHALTREIAALKEELEKKEEESRTRESERTRENAALQATIGEMRRQLDDYEKRNGERLDEGETGDAYEEMDSIDGGMDMFDNQLEIPEENMGEDEEENEDIDETMNYSNANEIMTHSSGEDTIDDEDASETVEVKKKRRSSRHVPRQHATLADCESPDNSDVDSEPVMKKSKAESSKMKKKLSSTIKKKSQVNYSMKRSGVKVNAHDLECTECTYRTHSARALVIHLRRHHHTSLALAGLALRCQCGVESLSAGHVDKCDIANFTLVRKREGPIRTFRDAKTTPQCLLCDAYPKTPFGYVHHLYIHHQTYLSSHGIYLLCECGVKYRHSEPDSEHAHECTRREYTLHKIADE